MRVRPDRQSPESRPLGRAKLRRPHLPRPHLPQRERTVAAPSESPPDPGPDLSDERRLRESGGPRDLAMYTCSCGYVFEADVSTSVACPHCGASQAW